MALGQVPVGWDHADQRRPTQACRRDTVHQGSETRKSQRLNAYFFFGAAMKLTPDTCELVIVTIREVGVNV